MSETAPENEGADLDPADLDDLGELGEGEEADESSGEDDYTPPDKDTWAKLQRKIQRQEERITRLTRGKAAPAKSGTVVDQALLGQLGQGKSDEADQGEDDQTSRWRGIAVQNAAAAEIKAAGFSGSAKDAVVLARLMDTSGLEPDRDGNFDLEDEVDALKERFPQLFAEPAGGRRPAPRVRTAPEGKTPPVDPSRKMSDALLRGAGYR